MQLQPIQHHSLTILMLDANIQALGLVEDLRREVLEKQSELRHLQLADVQGRKRVEEVERSTQITQHHLGR